MKLQRNSYKKYTKTIAIVGLVLFACLTLLATTYALHLWPFNTSTSTTSSDTSPVQESSMNNSPPTQAEIESSQDGKKNSAEAVDQDTSTSSERTKVSVEISYADKLDESQLDIRAFTPSVIEGTGTCTATLTRGADTVTSSSNGFVDASSTICEPIRIPLSKFQSSGTWNLVVAYDSPTSVGTSNKVEVDI